MSAEELERQQRQHMPARRRQRMGDLTEPLKRERGEDIINRSAHSPRGEPSDLPAPGYAPPIITGTVMQPNARQDRITAGVGSVYQTLPANAGKANFSDRKMVQENVIHTGIFTNKIALEVRIPKGRVFFATQLRVNVVGAFFDAVTDLGIPQNFVSLTLSRNGSIEVFNQQIKVAPLDGFMDVSLWAGPDDVVQVLFSADYSAFIDPDVALFVLLEVNLVGDMLLTNDSPYPYTGLNQK